MQTDNQIQTVNMQHKKHQFDKFLNKFERIETTVMLKNGYKILSLLNPHATEFIPKKHQTRVLHSISNEVLNKNATIEETSDAKTDSPETSDVMSTGTFSLQEDTQSYTDKFSDDSYTIEITEKNIKILTKPIKPEDYEQTKYNKTKVEKTPVLVPHKAKKALVENVLKPASCGNNLRKSISSKSEVKSYKRNETQTVKFKTPSAISRTLSNNGFKSICANILKPLRTCETKTTHKTGNDNQNQNAKTTKLQEKSKIASAFKEELNERNMRNLAKKVLKPN